MAKFHVNPTTGNSGECSAQDGNCPFGSDAPHFSTPEDARVAYEISQNGSWPGTPNTSVAKVLVWEDYAFLEGREDSLKKADTDYGFNWSAPGGGSQSRVSLAKWGDEMTGTLYVHNSATNRAAIIAREISMDEVDEVWHEMLKQGSHLEVNELHDRLRQRH